MTAKGDALEALEELDATLELMREAVVIPYTKINDAMAQVIEKNTKGVVKLIEKILKRVNKESVALSNRTDAIQTTVLRGLDQYLLTAYNLVQQLAVKGDVIRPGEPLEAALAAEVAEGPQVQYLGTLLLAMREAVPWLERIAAALEDIAERMNPTPAEATVVESGVEPQYAVAAREPRLDNPATTVPPIGED